MILIAIPPLFGDDVARSLRLVNVEPYGLWVEGKELRDELEAIEDVPYLAEAPTAFIPFTQILYVVDPTDVTGSEQRAVVAESVAARSRGVGGQERQEPRVEHRPPQRRSKKKGR